MNLADLVYAANEVWGLSLGLDVNKWKFLQDTYTDVSFKVWPPIDGLCTVSVDTTKGDA